MRVIICDFCGIRQIIPGDDNICKVPNGWLDLYVAETVKEDCMVNLCPLCKEAYDKRYSLARSVLSDTMNNWIKGHLIDVKTMMENEANRYKDEEEEEEE